MTYSSLFLDSDIILDLLFERYPFSEYTKLLLIKCASKNIKLNTSALVIANINYLVSKKLGQQTAKEKIKALLQYITVLPFESDAIDFALTGDFDDFEDAIQHHIAQKFNCGALITRNIKDYKYATIPVLTADQFLRTLL